MIETRCLLRFTTTPKKITSEFSIFFIRSAQSRAVTDLHSFLFLFLSLSLSLSFSLFLYWNNTYRITVGCLSCTYPSIQLFMAMTLKITVGCPSSTDPGILNKKNLHTRVGLLGPNCMESGTRTTVTCRCSPGHLSSTVNMTTTATICPAISRLCSSGNFPLQCMVAVGRFGIFELLRKTHDLAAACSSSHHFENSDQTRREPTDKWIGICLNFHHIDIQSSIPDIWLP